MMEFYSERCYKAKKEHQCEMCGGKIMPGELYFQEKGKWCGDFFSRALHVQCHMLEIAYCTEVDNEFSWDAIYEYAQDEYCDTCEHSCRFEDREDWTDCCESVSTCPKILAALKEKYKWEDEICTA